MRRGVAGRTQARRVGPVRMTSVFGAEDTVFGAILSTCFSAGNVSQASLRSLGDSGSFR